MCAAASERFARLFGAGEFGLASALQGARVPMSDTGKLSQAIEAYLATHPLAADSAEGVARWWLAPSGAKASAADVEPALEALVRRGRLRCVTLADGNKLYSGIAEAGVSPMRRM